MMVNLSKEDQEFVDTFSQPQFDSFKGAVQEQVNAKGQRFEEAKKTLESNMSKRKGWSDSFSSITGGAGKINSGIMQAQQEEQRANSTQYETAKKQLDSLQNETEKQSDQDLQSAQSLVQLIPELDKSNNAILSA